MGDAASFSSARASEGPRPRLRARPLWRGLLEAFPSCSVEPNGDETRDARLFHRHAVESARGLHRALVVCNDEELRLGGHLVDLRSEAPDVRLIEWRVHLVEQTEGRRPV